MRCDAARRAAAAVSGADKEVVRKLPMQTKNGSFGGFEGMAKLPDGMKEQELFQVTRCCINWI